MALEVEVIKADYPGGEAEFNLTCIMEDKESGKRLYKTSTASVNRLPMFKFEVSKPVSHKTTLEFFIASRESRNTCCCLCPLGLTHSSKKTSGELPPTDISKRVRLVHLATPILHSAMEKIVARLWFKVRDLRQKPQSGTISTTLQMFTNTFAGQNSKIKQLFFKEQNTMCDFAYTITTHPTIFVVFHSVAFHQTPTVSSASITPIAFLDTSPAAKVTSLFVKKGGTICTVPFLRAIKLECSERDNELLQLHVATREETTPLFSVTIPPTALQPFRPYNWEYNLKWMENKFSFSPEFSQENVEPNLTVSLLYWPSSANCSNYEGLEIFVEQLHLETVHKEKDIVLCCKLVGENCGVPTTSASRSCSQTEKIGDGRNARIAVMQSLDISNPAYFFLPSCLQFCGDFKVSLNFYASCHNTGLWWSSGTTSSVVKLKFSDHLRKEMMSPKNKQGLKLEFLEDGITHMSYNNAPIFRKLNVIIRWKKKEMGFLSESEMVKLNSSLATKEELLLDEASILHVQSLFPPTHPSSRKESEISNHSFREVIAKMGHDILHLREQNEILRKENRDYERHILGMEASVVVTAAERKSLLLLTQHDLIDKVVDLSERLVVEKETRKSFQSKISTLENSLIKKNDIESSYFELREAHAAQQTLLRELQGKIVKYKKCMLTCKQQELIISNLESLLSEQARDYRTKETMVALSKENSHLRATLNDYQYHPTGKEGVLVEKEKTISTLQKELLKLSKRCQKLESTMRDGLTMEGTDIVNKAVDQDERAKCENLKRELEMAEVREGTVMQELKSNARKWAREKAKYEQQLAELRPASTLRSNSHMQQRQRRGTSEESLLPRAILQQSLPCSSVTDIPPSQSSGRRHQVLSKGHQRRGIGEESLLSGAILQRSLPYSSVPVIPQSQNSGQRHRILSDGHRLAPPSITSDGHISMKLAQISNPPSAQ